MFHHNHNNILPQKHQDGCFYPKGERTLKLIEMIIRLKTTHVLKVSVIKSSKYMC